MKLTPREAMFFVAGYLTGGVVLSLMIMFFAWQAHGTTISSRVVEPTTPEQVKAELAKPGPMVLLYSTDWCPGCKIFEPIYAELSTKMKDVRFLKLNSDNIRLKEHQKAFQYIPFLMVGKDEATLRGKPCKERPGQRHDAATTERFIRECLK